MPGGRAACHVPNFTLVNVRLCTALPCLPTLLGLTLNPALHCPPSSPLPPPPLPLLPPRSYDLTDDPAIADAAFPEPVFDTSSNISPAESVAIVAMPVAARAAAFALLFGNNSTQPSQAAATLGEPRV